MLTIEQIQFHLNEKVKCFQVEFNEKLTEFINSNFNSFVDHILSVKADTLSTSQIHRFPSVNYSQDDNVSPPAAQEFVYTKESSNEMVEHGTPQLHDNAEPPPGVPEYQLKPEMLAHKATTTKPTVKKPGTNAREKPVECDKCSKMFAHKKTLRQHTKTQHACESERRVFVCDICPKQLTSKMGLITHRRTHTGEHWYQCDICSKSFAQKNTLVVHLRTHTNERPFMCDQCLKTFNQPSAFKRHQLTHAGIKPFKCVLCERAFVEKTKLNVHMLSHTGERPYVCPVCQRGYSKNYHLKKHVRNFHKVEDAESVLGPPKLRRSNIRLAQL